MDLLKNRFFDFPVNCFRIGFDENAYANEVVFIRICWCEVSLSGLEHMLSCGGGCLELRCFFETVARCV